MKPGFAWCLSECTWNGPGNGLPGSEWPIWNRRCPQAVAEVALTRGVGAASRKTWRCRLFPLLGNPAFPSPAAREALVGLERTLQGRGMPPHSERGHV